MVQRTLMSLSVAITTYLATSMLVQDGHNGLLLTLVLIFSAVSLALAFSFSSALDGRTSPAPLISAATLALIVAYIVFADATSQLWPLISAAVTFVGVFLSVQTTAAHADEHTDEQPSIDADTTATPATPATPGMTAVNLNPSHIAWIYHKLITMPYYAINDEVTHTEWGKEDIVTLTPGDHFAAGFSNRFNLNKRLNEKALPVLHTPPKRIFGRLGPLNSSTYHFTVSQ